jgi:4-amino-4-deoxy-L-arabinose transferase-like glycosyltransferase
LVVFLMAAGQAIYKGTILALAILAALALFRRRAYAPSFPPLPGWQAALAIPAAAFAVWGFVHAMAPELSPDGSAYHLGNVARYYREHGFSVITTSMYANLSQGLEMLFLFAFGFGRHSGAALMHFAYFLCLPWLMLSYGRRFGFPSSGACAAVAVLVSPVVGIDGASAYNDVAVAAVLFGSFYLLRIWEQTGNHGVLIPAGLLAGFAFAIKYTAFPAAPFALAFVAWKRAPWRRTVWMTACAALMIGPWLIKNTIVVSNPVSPFFNRWFPNPYFHPSAEEQYRRDMQTYGLQDRRVIPIEVTVRGEALNGFLGPLFLLTPLALLALRQREGRLLLAAGVVYLLPYPGNIGTRFLIPPLPFWALALALAFDRFPRALVVVTLAHCISAWPSVLNYYCKPYAWRFDAFEWRAALRWESEHDFLVRKCFPYQVARLVQEGTPAGARIISPGQVAEAYTNRDVLVVYQSAEGQRLGTQLYAPVIRDWVASRRHLFRFPRISTAGVRVVQLNSHDRDEWYVSELHVYSGGAELERRPQWRLRADPMPWEVGEAFDNSIMTGWRSWRPIRPGMTIEVRFPSAVGIDQVAIDSPGVEYSSAMALEILNGNGQWMRLDSKPTPYLLGHPLDLRRAATEVLASNGITHVLLHEGDHMAPDVEQRAQDWSLTKIGERAGFRLYSIR